MRATTTTVSNAFNDDNERPRKRTSRPKPKPLRQGDVTKKRCDQCLGAGKVPCYNCTRGGVAKCDKVGYVPVAKNFMFQLPFGWTQERRDDETTTKNKKKEAEANTIERCSVCSANNNGGTPGKLACARCNGQGSLLYRSADWR